MAFSPIEQAITDNCFKKLRLIATDMDGTLTQRGKFTASLLQAFEDLRAADIPVLIVTGRSAGWVSGLVTYLPVVGAIAENGGLFYPADSAKAVALTPIPDFVEHRQQLEVAYQRLKSEFPHIQESTDNRFRLTDWTFDNRDLTVTQLERLDTLCSSMGWGFTYSSVQCHIKPASQDKARGLMQVLHGLFPPVRATASCDCWR
jgi:HAD superfamily hydrolase (TIGR01484 family)